VRPKDFHFKPAHGVADCRQFSLQSALGWRLVHVADDDDDFVDDRCKRAPQRLRAE
jgi:hypothetical protein